jgi:hypothetical protein
MEVSGLENIDLSFFFSHSAVVLQPVVSTMVMHTLQAFFCQSADNCRTTGQ